MDASRLKIWETLFQRALQVLDSTKGVIRDGDWTFGGGTVLMRRYSHRFSKDCFTARDILDLALIVEKEPVEVERIRPILRDRRETVLERISSADTILRTTFDELELLEYRRNYDECVAIVTEAFQK